MSELEKIKSKIIKPDTLASFRDQWEQQKKTLVFTNGCFDILHKGHVEYLAKASELGDILVLGLNSDNSVRRIKGPGRPVQDEQSRAMILAALSFVGYIVIFDEDTPYELIKTARPDFLVKGADYKPEDIVGYDVVTSRGGKVVTINFVEGYSSSSIIKKVSNGKTDPPAPVDL